MQFQPKTWLKLWLKRKRLDAVCDRNAQLEYRTSKLHPRINVFIKHEQPDNECVFYSLFGLFLGPAPALDVVSKRFFISLFSLSSVMWGVTALPLCCCLSHDNRIPDCLWHFQSTEIFACFLKVSWYFFFFLGGKHKKIKLKLNSNQECSVPFPSFVDSEMYQKAPKQVNQFFLVL